MKYQIKRKLISILIFSLLAIVVLNAWFYFLQPGMIFYPDKEITSIPKDWGLAYEDVSLTSSDNIKLHGWYLPAKHSDKVLLFFHGNAGNISHRGDSLRIFHSLGLNVLIIDYRGYGKSEGTMSEQGAYRDGMAAWRYLVDEREFTPKDIIIFGRSLGGAVATQLATQVDERALILESTFSSAKDMANMMMPLLSKIIYFRYQFDTEKRVGQVNAPILLMHSQDDEVIPYELSEKIFAAATSPKYFYELHGDHNSGFIQYIAGYRQAIEWFLENNQE
ncbi:MAG: alpha/beta hydrolase [Thioalkalispiraceae bacterium]|jgi:hypothetical protein